MLSVGTYPDTSLKPAREKRDDARRLLAANIDPSAKRQAERLARADTFGAVGREWLEMQRAKFAPATFTKAQWILQDLLFPQGQPTVMAALKLAPLVFGRRPWTDSPRFHEIGRRRCVCQEP